MLMELNMSFNPQKSDQEYPPNFNLRVEEPKFCINPSKYLFRWQPWCSLWGNALRELYPITHSYPPILAQAYNYL